MLILGIAIIIVGIFVDTRGRAMGRALRKYEFENRTQGGVVQFSDFDAAERHARRKYWAVLVPALSGILYLVGLVLALVGYFGNR